MASTYPIRFASQMREHLRALRKMRGLTQAQLGNQLGVSQARIAEIEANPGLVSFEQLLQLLAHLGSGLLLEVEELAPSTKLDVGAWSIHEPAPAAYSITTSGSKTDFSKPAEAKLRYTFTKKKGSW
jgi:HTH-type transcriptional regulator/antitoxin HipB